MSEPIVWYPGHMAAAKRELTKSLVPIDFVIELLDARIPVSSRNPDLKEICAGKPRLTLLTKCTLADPARTAEHRRTLEAEGAFVIAIDSKTKQGYDKITPAIKTLNAEKLKKYSDKGMAGRKLRGMVLGITNVGKSTFINRYTGTNKAKAEDRPGVTRSTQWISAPGGIELLDTPGLLWHKFDDPAVGEKLAFTGAIRDEILDITEIAASLAALLIRLYPDLVAARYKVQAVEGENAEALLERMTVKRGLLQRGGVPDTERFAACLLDEFRSGKIGRITLD